MIYIKLPDIHFEYLNLTEIFNLMGTSWIYHWTNKLPATVKSWANAIKLVCRTGFAGRHSAISMWLKNCCDPSLIPLSWSHLHPLPFFLHLILFLNLKGKSVIILFITCITNVLHDCTNVVLHVLHVLHDEHRYYMYYCWFRFDMDE